MKASEGIPTLWKWEMKAHCAGVSCTHSDSPD